jgi:UDP-glucose 4,6-dehydratase
VRPSRADAPPARRQFVKGDITSADFMLYLLREERVDTILHFAAQTHVDASFGNSFAFTQNNVVGTHALLEAARMSGAVRRFLHVSTDEVYGTEAGAAAGGGAACETATVLAPTNPYAATKAAAEMLVKAYAASYRLPCVVTRSNNVYGPGQYPEKLVPKFALLAAAGARLPVHGDGKALRSFLHVRDAAAAFDVVLHAGADGGVFNVGSRRERSVLEVAAAVCAHFGRDAAAAVQHVPDRLFNDRRYFIDDAKLTALGWAPRVAWEDGLAETIDWYVRNVAPGGWWPAHEAALAAHPSPAPQHALEQLPPPAQQEEQGAAPAEHDEAAA